MAKAKLSQKPVAFRVNDRMYDCESCVPKINIKADGQDQPVSGQTYDTLAVKITDPNTVQFTAKKAGKPEFESTRTASQDGKTLTISSTNYPADGSQPSKSEAKVTQISKGPAGSNAVSGSWRVQNVNEDSAGLTNDSKKTCRGVPRGAAGCGGKR